MGTSNYSDEFKRDAVQQIRVRGYPVREVSHRLEVSSHALCRLMKLVAEPASNASGEDHEAEYRRLKRELSRVAEERDILKMGEPWCAIGSRTVASDFTCIKTHEGWRPPWASSQWRTIANLAVVIDPFLRRVVGWSTQPRMTTDLALQALLSAVWRRKPKAKVMIHSDPGSQVTSREWQAFHGMQNLDASMSRRGNCHDNAVAESVFHLMKRERIRRHTNLTREAARQDAFECIAMCCNPKRKHTNNGMLSPFDFENRQQKLNQAGV